jgi:SRSO17 transposase
MFRIVKFPSKLEPYFRSLKTYFRWNHFEYFKTLVVLVAFSWERRNISSLYRHLDARAYPHRTRFNNFLGVGRWEPEKALAHKAYELLAKLRPRKGETIELIIDDSMKGKRGKEMEAVGFVYDPVNRRIVLGHKFVKATIRFRGHTIPFGISLYVKEEDSEDLDVEFKKTTRLAAELIRAFEAPAGCRVRVLFDNFYLCPVVVKACRKKGFRFVSTLKSNRNLFKGSRKLKAGKYGAGLFRRSRRKRRVFLKKKHRVTYWYVDAGWLRVGDLGQMHVIFSRKKKEPRILGIVTDDPKLTGANIIRAYDGRWSIEVFFRDAKQLLGLGQYQNRSYRAAVTHLHLVCFAYALLTHIAIEREGAQGKRKKKAAKMSTGDLQNELRRIVWDELAKYLRELPSGNSVVKELDRLITAA